MYRERILNFHEEALKRSLVPILESRYGEGVIVHDAEFVSADSEEVGYRVLFSQNGGKIKRRVIVSTSEGQREIFPLFDGSPQGSLIRMGNNVRTLAKILKQVHQN